MFIRSNWNVPNNMGTLMWEIVCDVSIEYVPERVSNVKACELNCTQFEQGRGWAPQISLDERLLHTREWLRGSLG